MTGNSGCILWNEKTKSYESIEQFDRNKELTEDGNYFISEERLEDIKKNFSFSVFLQWYSMNFYERLFVKDEYGYCDIRLHEGKLQKLSTEDKIKYKKTTANDNWIDMPEGCKIELICLMCESNTNLKQINHREYICEYCIGEDDYENITNPAM